MTSVLVVDDDEDLRLLYDQFLTLEGLEVRTAATGPEALEALRGWRPDVALLDVQMPEVDGWDTLRAIRADPGLADLPVVLCTVRGSAGSRVRGWELGCDGFVSKPFDPATVTAELRAVAARAPGERDATRAAGLERAREALREQGR